MEAQAEALHFSIETRRFLASSPLIAGSTADYGCRWADALGRTDLEVLKAEIDALSATESLRALTPIVRAAGRVFETQRDGSAVSASPPTIRKGARGVRSRRSGSRPMSTSSPATTPGTAASRSPAWCSRSRNVLEPRPPQSLWSAIRCTIWPRRGRPARRRSPSFPDPPGRAALEPHADFVIEHIGDLPDLLAAIAAE